MGFIDQAPEDLKTEPAFCVSPRDEEVMVDALSTEWVWMSELASSTADELSGLYKSPPFPVPIQTALLPPGVCTGSHMVPVGGAPSPKILPLYTEGLLSGSWMNNKAPLSGWQRIGVTGRGRAGKGVASTRPPAGL